MIEEFKKLYEECGGEMDDCVSEGEWTQDYKYQLRDDVYKYKDTFIQVSQSRSGSYHTDWDYDAPVFSEVRPEERVVTTTVWHLVK